MEAAGADPREDRLGHDRAGRVPCAQEQYVEGRGHGGALLGDRGQQARKVAAQLGPAGAAGLGQEAEQRAKRREPGCVDHLPALTGGQHQAGTLQRAEVERGGRSRQAEPVGDLAGRQPVRSTFDQQPQRRQTALLRQGGEDLDGGFDFHASNIMESYSAVR
jgi:hypothetical protein